MKAPNRIKIVFDGGTAEIYGDVFSDMVTCYANRLYDRRKEATAKLATIQLNDENRLSKFKDQAYQYDYATSLLAIVDNVEKVFKNHKDTKLEYVQPHTVE
jgi:hypothetical protein